MEPSACESPASRRQVGPYLTPFMSGTTAAQNLAVGSALHTKQEYDVLVSKTEANGSSVFNCITQGCAPEKRPREDKERA